jgi:hypothetical protein
MAPTDSGLILLCGDEARGLEGRIFCESRLPYLGVLSEALEGDDRGEGDRGEGAGEGSKSSSWGEGGRAISSALI